MNQQKTIHPWRDETLYTKLYFFIYVVALLVLSRCVFLFAADTHFSWPPQPIHFPFIPFFLQLPLTLPPSLPTYAHTPPSWSCHLPAPAQSLLRPTAHLPPAPLTAPVANANAHTHIRADTQRAAASNPTCPDARAICREKHNHTHGNVLMHSVFYYYVTMNLKTPTQNACRC